MNNYTVYLHIRNKTNQKYVGITSLKPEARWREGRGYSYNKEFYQDILQDGWDEGFQHIILHNNLTYTEAVNLENYYMDLYNTLDKECGYNKIGSGLRKNINKESRIKFSKAQKQRYRRLQEHINTSQSIKYYYDTHPKTKQHLSEQRKKYLEQFTTDEKGLMNTQRIEIQCLETGICYNSISEASRKTGISRKSINNCINQKMLSAGGYHWAKIEKLNENASDIIINNIEQNRKPTGKSRKIICLETQEIFQSIGQAKKKYGGDIAACCQKRQKTAGNHPQFGKLHWEYLDN